ncbi:hypothetical protein [Psychrobacter sp. I-STPA6b]|uniref:hypothetical protein n=1 Tax=Psychrobacter sp. I-STPA6b TaxID=2585718 RepID=UPI001D0C7D46|nr:hypothetical protein [Psychrobacter sp. I-STPA6b]
MKDFAKRSFLSAIVMILIVLLYAFVGTALDKEIQNQDAVIERHKFYLAQSKQPSIVWTRRYEDLRDE